LEYAIVDIETTGGFAADNDITEIAIYCYNGKEITAEYTTLVRPEKPIPYFIQVLTGISHEIVEKAPKFEDIAAEVAKLLKGRVFIAHNVNFDYSFLKYHLEKSGYKLDAPKLCTVRLSRKAFPGLVSYSLGNLCRALGIPIENRHRAGGDAKATCLLFQKILEEKGDTLIKQFLKRNSKEMILPLNLPAEAVINLPYCPGVYYFHDEKGTVIYVGKAKNIKYRVTGHFSNNSAGKKKQEFLRNIYKITYTPCGSELMALILESVEIKRLWPKYNRSLKNPVAGYGLYCYEGQAGFMHLVIDRLKKFPEPLYLFDNYSEGHSFLKSLAKKFNLCPKLSALQWANVPCSGIEEGYCFGACEQKEPAGEYNKRVQEALEYINHSLPSFALLDKGRTASEKSCILVEKGRFVGMGYIPVEASGANMEKLKEYIQLYPENEFIRKLVFQIIGKKNNNVVIFPSSVPEISESGSAGIPS
jgi:DNA polymerase-3 subunit epsilon